MQELSIKEKAAYVKKLLEDRADCIEIAKEEISRCRRRAENAVEAFLALLPYGQ